MAQTLHFAKKLRIQNPNFESRNKFKIRVYQWPKHGVSESFPISDSGHSNVFRISACDEPLGLSSGRRLSRVDFDICMWLRPKAALGRGGQKMINEAIKPSRWYYGLAVLVFLTGASVFGLFLFENLSGLTDRLPQLVVPGEYEIMLSETGKYTIFHEYQSVVGNRMYSARQDLSGLRCSLISKESGAQVRLYRASMTATYSAGSRAGVSVFNFMVDHPGNYEFSAWYPKGREGPEVVLAIDCGFTRRLMGTIFGGLAIFFGTLGVTAVIAIITFVKRQKAKEQLEANYA